MLIRSQFDTFASPELNVIVVINFPMPLKGI